MSRDFDHVIVYLYHCISNLENILIKIIVWYKIWARIFEWNACSTGQV